MARNNSAGGAWHSGVWRIHINARAAAAYDSVTLSSSVSGNKQNASGAARNNARIWQRRSKQHLADAMQQHGASLT